MANYLTTIKTAFFVFPILAFLFTIPFILNQYHKYASIQKIRVIIIYSFILYMLTAYFMVILPLPSRSSVLHLTTPRVRLSPFFFIGDFLAKTSLVVSNPSTYLSALKEACFYVPAFNILLTIPFGMYLRYYFRCSLKKTVLFSFLLSLFYELTQLSGLYFIYPRSYRLFDVDDLILNTLGGVIGYFIMGFIKFLPKREAIDAIAYEDGMTVSGMRRITGFFLDLFIYLVLSILLYLVFDNVHFIWISFIFYYILIPIFFDGKTIGSNFLNYKMVFRNLPVLRIPIRVIFMICYYVAIPILLFISASYFSHHFVFSKNENILVYGVILLFLFIFHLMQMIRLLRGRKAIYDELLEVRFQSTILEKRRNFK